MPVAGDERNGPGRVARGEGVMDRLLRRPGRLMPGARALVQGRHQGRFCPGQPALQQLREQVVVPVPLPVVVEWHQEEILPVEHLDDPRGTRRPGDHVAERGAEPGQHRGPGQELLDLGGLAAEHLLGQEVHDEPVVAGELPDEGVRRRIAAQRDRGQIHPGWPSLGSFHELIEVGFAELDSGYGEQQLRGLPGGEAQLAGPHLGQFPGRPQAGQRQWRICPRDDHDLHGRWQVQQQERDLLLTAAVPDHVVVVEHQDRRRRQSGQFVRQHRQHRPRKLRGLRT